MSNKIHCISYASNHYVSRIENFTKEVNNFGIFDTHKVYTPEDISSDFYSKFENIINMPRGGGYWIWKLDIINQHLNLMNDGDVLIYSDVGCTVSKTAESVNRLYEYVDIINTNSFLRFALTHLEECYSNSTALEYFAKRYNADINELKNSYQIMATIMGFKKDSKTRYFLDELSAILDEDRNIITDYYNNLNRSSRFIDHRHDQTMLSLLHKSLKCNGLIDDETWTTDWDSIKHVPFQSTRRRH